MALLGPCIGLCTSPLAAGIALLFLPLAQTQPPQPAAPTGSPKLVVERTVWDFGTVWTGEPCSTTIKLTNTGDAPLKIEKVESTCGCTVPKPSKTVLAPGESDDLHITYNTRKAIVDVRQTVTLRTNDPQHPRTEIVVRGVVKQVYECKPVNRLAFGQVLFDALETRSIELTNNLSEPIKLSLPPEARQPMFEIRLDEIEPGRKYKLSATTRPPLRPASNYLNLKLKTDHARFPTLDIAVSAYAVDRVGVSPTEILLTPKMEIPATRLVRVNYLPDRPVKITGLSTSHPDQIKVSTTPARPPTRTERFAYQLVKVEITALTGLPEKGAKVTITTDDPEPRFQKLEVAVEVFTPPEGELDPADFE